jgi:perosamine synthetase
VKVPLLKIPFSDEEIRGIQDGIAEVLRSGVLSGGEKSKALETEWAKYCGAPHTISCTSGTAALEIMLRAIELEDTLGTGENEVVLPSNTMVATAMAVIHAGGRIVLADCDRETMQMSVSSVREVISKDTVAVLAVHIGGYISPSVFQLRDTGKNLWLLEDACHAHGAEITSDGKWLKAGSIGDMGAFSFYPTKVLTCGEGGIITIPDADAKWATDWLDQQCGYYRDFCRSEGNSQLHEAVGYNWRMDEIRAVIALQQVRKVDKILAERRQIAKWYDERLEGVEGVQAMKVPDTMKPSYYKYIVFTEQPNMYPVLKERMHKSGVELPGLVYEVPLHKQPVMHYLKSIGRVRYNEEELRNTDWVSQHHICPPLYPSLTEGEVEHVVQSLKKALAKNSLRGEV